MSIFSSIGGVVSDIFGAVGDQKQAGGYKAQAAGYRRAADFSDQSAELTARSNAIQLQQQERNSYKILGGQQADIAGAGFGASGSALDLMRSSRQQSALSNQLLSAQGQITQQGYRAEADSYRAQAAGADAAGSAQNTKASGGFASAVGGILGIGLSIFSDRRLKKNVEPYDNYRGLNLYTFQYIWEADDAPKTVGLMAQEIMLQYPDCVFANDEGFYVINLDELTKQVA